MSIRRLRQIAAGQGGPNWWAGVLAGLAGLAAQAADTSAIRVPLGFTVEEVAAAPLVEYPMLACLDDRGRLFVAEGTGTNLPGTELVNLRAGKIRLLEDTDGDGRFDHSQVFADQLVFPQGVLWHQGALYAASHPNIWRFPDDDNDGRADRHEVLVGQFGFNGNGCDLHGPFAGPDGWIYWTDGRHGYQVTTREGELLEGLASRIWRCRPDGRNIERICGGGFDNPVELAFLPDGELIGTMDQGPGDALLHYIEGAVFPRDHPSVAEFPQTGPLLGAVYQYSGVLPVALCGLTRYRSDVFGAEFQDLLLTAQFNVHRVEQHRLVRDGATFRCENRVFLESRDYDFHPTDVLEDADGSLLVVDMGAWFNFGCPTSKIAKPEVKGSILRVRRTETPRPSDAWGRQIAWRKLATAELIAMLPDASPVMRDRAIDRLVAQGEAAVEPLVAYSRRDGEREGDALPEAVRRDSLWALTRIGGPAARAAIREALNDAVPTIRLVAAHCVSLERDAAAFDQLATLVVEADLPLRRRAAEALGRLRQPRAVPLLLDSVRRGANDRFLEHALIYALIQIADRQATLPGLHDPHPRVRRAALIALDQMPGGSLTRDLIAPLLDTDDPDLRQTALDIISRHQGWAAETVELLQRLLRQAAPLPADVERSVTGALLAFSDDPQIQQLVAETLAAQATPAPTRRLLLGVIGRSRLGSLPAAWSAALAAALDSADAQVAHEAISAVRGRNLRECDAQLNRLSRRDDLPPGVRLAALETLASAQQALDAGQVDWLHATLADATDPLPRVAAARTLGMLSLAPPQLLKLAQVVQSGGPLIAPLLAPAFARSRDAEVGAAFVAALEKSAGAEAITAEELLELLRSYPHEVRLAAQPLLQRLAARRQSQEGYLAEVTGRTLQAQGDAVRGRAVFYSQKVGCYACHRVGDQGGAVGPDLSQIGRIRWPRDLLEAIVFPSSTIVPDYRTFNVATTDGRSLAGMIVRETSDALYLRTAQLAELRVDRRDVESLGPSPVSLMPDGLEKTMTSQELADLLEFLYQQR